MMNRAFILCLQISIISCAISVSISQLFLFISFLLFLFLVQWKKDTFQCTQIHLLAIGIFIFYFISFFYHLFTNGQMYLATVWKASELKDVLLLSAFFVVQHLKTKEDTDRIEKAFWLLFVVLLVTGIISIFSPIRLSRLVTDFIKPSTAWKFSHHYGKLFGIGIHLPIGFMNTHLTYGGIFLLFAPFTFFRFIFSIRDRKNILFHFIVLFLFGIVVLLNNARSSMLGGIISILVGFIDLLFIQKYFSFKNTIKLILVPIFLVGIFFSLFFYNETMSKTIQPLLGQEKHTDSGRTFIWSSTYPIIFSNPIFGIGPGNYGLEIEKARKQLSIQYKELLFFYEVTQRGHAHNDYLHIAAIAGLPAMIIYVLLGATIAYYLLQKTNLRSDHILFYGLIGFFFSGLYQCYFQDDEVVLVFWYLLGFFHLQIQNRNVQNKDLPPMK